ncbi:MAG: radical SAM family heme chaperone HemW [Fimbriimonas sp.]
MSLAVYVHIPFCPTKCGYCDFNSYAMEGDIMERTVRATIAEIRSSAVAGRPAKTIFFGGGTPTFLSEEQLLRVFSAVLETHPPVADAEITSEANPGTVDAEKFAAMRAAGFNRISMGAQSFLDSDLLALGRIHRSSEIERAFGAAREAGFDNLNLDLMFALPNQSAHGWRQNLTKALSLQPEHLSLYCLTIEPNTAFYKKNLRGQLALPDDEQQVAMYEECLDRTSAAGYEQYEISNFAKPGRECRHNLCYWHGEEYAGYGPGAVGALDVDGVRTRYTNLKHPDGYCSAVEQGLPLRFESECLDADTLKVERIMLGLRLNGGLRVNELDARALGRLEGRGWIERDQDYARLSRLGRHFCSEVALELI